MNFVGLGKEIKFYIQKKILDLRKKNYRFEIDNLIISTTFKLFFMEKKKDVVALKLKE